LPLEAEHEFRVILEAGGSRGAVEEFLAECLEEGLVQDALTAQSERQALDFWSVREGLPIEKLPNLLNFDVSLPISRIGEFAEKCGAALRARWPQCHNSFYGHVGDGNVHICVAAGEDMHAVDEVVYGALDGFGGSISAEHGIGTLKRPYLKRSRGAEELALMRTLKAALDPKGILNPGKVI
jgi:FAD/FMN-containing dehydrogenase